MKQLYDPNMFNYTWESIDHDQYVVGTYYLEDIIDDDDDFADHFDQVQRLALEGSTSSWQEVSEDTPEVRERLTSKVLGYFEVPAPKGKKQAVIQLGFAVGAWDVNVNVPMLLLSISGNFSVFATNSRLLDLYIPEKVAKEFGGPKFGISGIREILGVPERPLILQIIKPKMGMTPEETANQIYQSSLGGADLVKDDEMCSELANCSFDARLEAGLKALEKSERETGEKTLYMVSITDESCKVHEKALRAVRAGATGLLLAYSAGLSTLREIAEDPEITVPIMLHPSHMLTLLPRISFPVLSKLCRLCGADMMLSPSNWCSIPACSTEECNRNVQVMRAPFYHIRRTWPMPAAGMYPGVVPPVLQECGPDIIIPAGGGILGHPMGYTAGAKAWRQAFDAAMADIPLDEAAKDKPELRAALEKWGLRVRPRARWGYVGKQFHPDFAPKNI